MSEPQSYSNHTRFDPKFHFFAIPVLLITVFVVAGALVHHWPEHILMHAWLLVVVIALFLTAGFARGYALKVQDRIIRLEERLRYQRVLQGEALAASEKLTVRQMIALRFASDAELPGLVQRAVAENLSSKAIKESIKTWRADTFRV